MTSADVLSPLRAVPRRVLDAAGWLRLPLRSGRFWLVQAGVLFVAFLDEVVLDILGVQPPFEIPRSTITALLLVPVIYAALNFGVRGAVGTALWATALMFPDWLWIAGVTTANAWVEIGNLAILNAVALIVGQRVEREAQARLRAEGALRASEVAEARYRALFDEQHAPVLVTDADGVVTEANAAAVSLLGTGVSGRLLSDLVGTPVTAVLVGAVPRLPVGDRVFVPKARSLDVGSGERLVQIVLVDVTEEERRAREQGAYAAHLVTVQEDERRRLAQDLHDDPVQTLTYLVRMLEHLSDDARLPKDLAPLVLRNGELATEVVDALRTVIHGLRPPVLDDFGAVAALRQLVAEVRARHGISIRLRVSGDQVRLSAQSELTVYRVAQEALSNVVRHAQATRTRVDLHFGEQVVLTVTDDGRGIPASSTKSASSGGLGLIGMRERVNLVGGSLEVCTHAPHGTMVRATLPCQQSAADTLLS
ncbi:MAG: PAS domain-containing protein [Actinobacteria bacterium]|nr:PAS domain-containing protein [Actinomycetota bacterium]